ncbi:MAG: 6-phosphogluconolactonase [Verrucomicrobiota bacterium]|jgi:6-phosphogluconolactonase
MKNFELIFFSNPDELARAAASAWLSEIEPASGSVVPYCVALSGGRVTQKFFTEIVQEFRGLKTGNGFAKNLHFFWADERCVPPSDPESNFKMANELLFVPLKIGVNQIHRLRGEIPPQDAVELAAEELCSIAVTKSSNQPVLDLILLGMGEDGHVASLFPNVPIQAADKTAPFLVIENSPKPPPTRISLSYTAIAAAKKVWVLASGAGKAAALSESISPSGTTPLARVLRLHPGVKIFSDITPI